MSSETFLSQEQIYETKYKHAWLENKYSCTKRIHLMSGSHTFVFGYKLLRKSKMLQLSL